VHETVDFVDQNALKLAHEHLQLQKNFWRLYLRTLLTGEGKREGREWGKNSGSLQHYQFDVSRNNPGYVYGVMSEILKINMRYAGQQVGITAITVSVQCFATFSCII
jgi:hypothetical protein